MFLLTFDNRLGTAPPNKKDSGIEVKRVLDVGTGTGIWAMEFGDEHPETEVSVNPELYHLYVSVLLEVTDLRA